MKTPRKQTTTELQYIVTETQDRLIRRACRMRAALYGKHPEHADKFARELASMWREFGMEGVGLACRELQQVMCNVPGGYAFFAEARAIAAEVL